MVTPAHVNPAASLAGAKSLVHHTELFGALQGFTNPLPLFYSSVQSSQ